MNNSYDYCENCLEPESIYGNENWNNEEERPTFLDVFNKFDIKDCKNMVDVAIYGKPGSGKTNFLIFTAYEALGRYNDAFDLIVWDWDSSRSDNCVCAMDHLDNRKQFHMIVFDDMPPNTCISTRLRSQSNKNIGCHDRLISFFVRPGFIDADYSIILDNDHNAFLSKAGSAMMQISKMSARTSNGTFNRYYDSRRFRHDL